MSKARRIVELDREQMTQGVAYIMLAALFLFNFHYVSLHSSLASSVTWGLDIVVGAVFLALGFYKILFSSNSYEIGRRSR